MIRINGSESLKIYWRIMLSLISSIDMATPILNFIFRIFAMYSHQYYEKIIIWDYFTSQISKNKIK